MHICVCISVYLQYVSIRFSLNVFQQGHLKPGGDPHPCPQKENINHMAFFTYDSLSLFQNVTLVYTPTSLPLLPLQVLFSAFLFLLALCVCVCASMCAHFPALLLFSTHSGFSILLFHISLASQPPFSPLSNLP